MSSARPIAVMPIFGTRPEAVKLAPVIRALRGRADRFTTKVVVTGQHRAMLDETLEVFGIAPDLDLDLMEPGQTLARITSRALSGLDGAIASEEPDVVLVQGDTTTAFAATLAAFYHRVPVGHVEAGLRTGDRYDPFPEEINRRMIGTIASFHYAPTEAARDNLRQSGVADEAILVTGNTVIDALLSVADGLPDEARPARRQILVTLHRRENWGEPMRRVCLALRDLLARHSDVEVVFPMHRNPVVRETVRSVLGEVDRAHLVDPLSYREFVRRQRLATIIVTDSGGVQEEAPSLGVPVLVARDTTERPEGVAAGTVRLVGTDRSNVLREAERLLTDPAAYAAMAGARNPYGDGHASERIRDHLLAAFGSPDRHDRPDV